MSFKGTSNAHWRGRAAAVAGLAAAATVGALVYATSAQAAPPTRVSWDAPAQVVNDGSFDGPATLVVDNTPTGVLPIGPNVVARITVTGPPTLDCTTLNVTGAINWSTMSGSGGTCSEDQPYGPQGFTVVTSNEFFHVFQPDLTGTLTSTVSIVRRSAPFPGGTDQQTLGSGSDTTQLVAGHAPVFTSTPVPPATIYHAYNFTLMTDLGFPTVDDVQGNPIFRRVIAFGTHQNADGHYRWTTRDTVHTGDVQGATHDYLNLSDGFVFDLNTGQIRSREVETLDQTNSVRYWTWTIIANNGEGGTPFPGAFGVIGSGCCFTTLPTHEIHTHDVVSESFTTPVLFSDVPLGAPFSTEIYDLSDNGGVTPIINGFADGTFRPGGAVSRQAFAAFVARALIDVGAPNIDDGPCSTIHPSSFPDVQNSSPFCKDIRDLNELGIINGFSDGFHPNGQISRQAVSAILYRAYSYWLGAIVGDAHCTTPIPFNDVTTANPFCGDIEWMSDHGITNGYPDGGYHPLQNVTRAATAAFIDRIFLNSTI